MSVLGECWVCVFRVCVLGEHVAYVLGMSVLDVCVLGKC